MAESQSRPSSCPEASLDGHDGVSATAGRDQAALIGSIPAAGDRHRFTLAHELGHLVLRARRHSVDPEGEAHRSAGAFLVPARREAELVPANATLGVLRRVKAEWGVSIAALVQRGEAAGTLDRDRVQTPFKQISARGWRKEEPVEVTAETPRLLYRLLEQRYGDRPYASKAIERELALPTMTLRSLAPAPPQARSEMAAVTQLSARRR